MYLYIYIYLVLISAVRGWLMCTSSSRANTNPPLTTFSVSRKDLSFFCFWLSSKKSEGGAQITLVCLGENLTATFENNFFACADRDLIRTSRLAFTCVEMTPTFPPVPTNNTISFDKVCFLSIPSSLTHTHTLSLSPSLSSHPLPTHPPHTHINNPTTSLGIWHQRWQLARGVVGRGLQYVSEHQRRCHALCGRSWRTANE